MLALGIWPPFYTFKMTSVCPLSYFPSKLLQFFRHVMRYHVKNTLPVDGGYLDQTAVFCQAHDVASAMLSEILERKLKKKIGKN